MKEKSLSTYWQECFSEKYDNFQGRARRKEFWGFILFQTLVALTFSVAMFVAVERGQSPFITTPGILYIIYSLLSFVPGLSVAVRRLHDVGQSGWLVLIGFIPILGVLVLIAFYSMDGIPYTNKYGDDPKGRGLEA